VDNYDQKPWYKLKYKIFFINYFSVQPRIKNEKLQFWSAMKNNNMNNLIK